MSDIAYTDLRPDSIRAKHIKWPNLAAGDVGLPFGHPEHADRSIQFYGDFGAGTVIVEGRNTDEDEWATLSDPQGNDLVVSVADVYQVTEVTTEIRVRATAGVVDVTAALVARGNIW